MGYIAVLVLLVASLHLCVSDEFCPPPNVISPCDCDREGINCMKAKSDSELQRVFRSIQRPWKLRGIWIQITPMTVVPSGMFQGIEVQGFHLEINKIHTIQPGAFSGSEQSAFSISVFGNQLSSFPFEDLKNFPYLQSFNAGRNKILSIPEKAFYGHNGLSQILLPENMISYIGPNAFNNLPSLQRLDLLHNKISVLGPMSFAMSVHNPELMVNVANASITSISPTAFTGITPKVLHLSLNHLQHLEQGAFLPMVQRMARVGGQVDVTGNPFTCLGCEYSWVVLNKVVLHNIFYGFRCLDGRDIHSLNNWNIGCY